MSDQTAIALSTLILAGFWMVVSADGMTAPPRRAKVPSWVWLVSFAALRVPSFPLSRACISDASSA